MGVSKKRVIALIPTKNEEESIKKVITQVKPWVDKILIVDGYSKDKTVKIAKNEGVEILFQEGKGKGMGFQTFLKKYPIKKDEFYVMLDGDASYPAKDIPIFLENLKEYEIVSGKRKGVRFKLKNIVHFIGNKIISLLGFLLYGKYIDICTGMWGFRGDVLKSMKISAKGFELEADLFMNMRRLNLKSKEILIDYFPRIGEEKLKESDGFRIIYFLIRKKFIN